MIRLSVLIMALLSAPADAQFALSARTDLGSTFHQVTLTDTSEVRIRQVVSPINIESPVGGATISLTSGFMYVEQTAGDVSTDAWGPLDTQVSANWIVRGIHATGFTILPTGKRELDASEGSIVRVINGNNLNFPVKTFGQGLDYGGAVTWGYQHGHTGFSVGASYTARGEYEPFEKAGRYRPGDEATAAVGLSYFNRGWTVSLDVAGTFLFTDRLNGLVIFQNGKQLVSRLAAGYETRLFQITTSVTDIVRYRDRALSQAGHLLYEVRDNNGNDLRASGRIVVTAVPSVTIWGHGHLKAVSENPHPVGDPLHQGSARVYGFGGGATVKVGSAERVDVSVTRYDGWLDEGARDLKGWNARVSLQILF